MHQMTTPERFDPMKRYVYEHLANGSFKPMWIVPSRSNKPLTHVGILRAISRYVRVLFRILPAWKMLQQLIRQILLNATYL